MAAVNRPADVDAIPTVEVDNRLLAAAESAIKAAVDYEEATGRKLGITGEVGEILVCHRLGLRLVKASGAAGFDAIDTQRNRVQIKTRRDSKGGAINSVGTVGKFTNFDFDYALYAELDTGFEVSSIYKIERDALPSLIKRKDNALTVHDFRKYGREVFKKK